jgi:hypothetical protein
MLRKKISISDTPQPLPLTILLAFSPSGPYTSGPLSMSMMMKEQNVEVHSNPFNRVNVQRPNTNYREHLLQTAGSNKHKST